MKKNILLLLILLSQFFSKAQNVGIGVDTPKHAKLEVHGAVGGTSAIFGGDGAGMSLQRNWPGIGFNQYYNGASKNIGQGYAAVQYLDPEYGYMAIDMFGYGLPNLNSFVQTRQLTLTNDGRMAIGTNANPTASIFVARGYGNATASFLGTTYHSHFNSGSSEDTYIRAGRIGGTVYINDIQNSKIVLNGNIGINTSTPTYPLEIRQPAGDRGWCLVNANNFHNWEYRVSGADGDLRLYYDGVYRGEFKSDGSYHSTSDARLKTNITPLASTLDKLMQLKPVSYEMIHKNPSHKKSIGFIAQEVQNIFPELVTVLKDTANGYKNISDLHAINYSGFSVLTIKAIQEQQAIIDKQQQQIKSLEEKLSAIERRLFTASR